jgi:hypothetical protein
MLPAGADEMTIQGPFRLYHLLADDEDRAPRASFQGEGRHPDHMV